MKCKRVKSNLLQAEVYERFPVETINKEKRMRYMELRDVEVSNGFVQKYVVADYPITPDSVNSYADSADYRRNPEVINQAVSGRKNLGDIVEAQKIMQGSDMATLQELVGKAREVLDKVKKAGQPPSPTDNSSGVLEEKTENK